MDGRLGSIWRIEQRNPIQDVHKITQNLFIDEIYP